MAYRKHPLPRHHTPQAQAASAGQDQGVTFQSAFPESPEGTPLPSGALTINLSASGDLVVYIPPSPGHSKGHTAFLPATNYGLAALLQLLRDRASAPRGKIGTKAAPTSFMLDAYAKALAKGHQVQGQKLTIDDLDLSADLDGDLA